MISKIDIAIFLLERLCGEILHVINDRKDTDDFTDLVKDCVNKNKELVGLERYNISINSGMSPNGFSVTFYFKVLQDSLTVGFHDANSIGTYSAHLCNNHIVVTQPSSLFTKDLMFCSPYNKILYVDYFTTWVPIDDEDRVLSVAELQDRKRLDFDLEKKNNFFSFYERLIEQEKKNLLIINVDSQQQYDAVLGLICKEYVSAVVTGDAETYVSLKSQLPTETVVYKQDERIRPLAKRQWFARAVRQIDNNVSLELGKQLLWAWGYYRKVQKHESFVAFNKWVVNLAKYHQIPYSMVYDVCCCDDYREYYDIEALLNEIRGIEWVRPR